MPWEPLRYDSTCQLHSRAAALRPGLAGSGGLLSGAQAAAGVRSMLVFHRRHRRQITYLGFHFEGAELLVLAFQF